MLKVYVTPELKLKILRYAPTVYLVFCTNLRKINGYFLLHHWLTGCLTETDVAVMYEINLLNTNEVNISL